MVFDDTLRGSPRAWRAIGAIAIPCLFWIGCGPSGDRSVSGVPVPVLDDQAWGLTDLSLSPDGRTAAVSAASSTERAGFRLFLVNLDTLVAFEAQPSFDATAQLIAETRPGLIAGNWDSEGTHLRFPAGNVEPSSLLAAYQDGMPKYQQSVTIGSKAWFEVTMAGRDTWVIDIDDSPETIARPRPRPDSIDPRLSVRWHGRGSFDLIDIERGGRTITSFRSRLVWFHLVSAAVSPDGEWIGLTIGREAFFSHGRRGLLVERATGRRLLLGDEIRGPLNFRPFHREVYGVSGASPNRAELLRWRY